MHKFTPYSLRKVQFLGLKHVNHWSIKMYYLSANAAPPDESFVSTCIDAVSTHLPNIAITQQRYGVGFCIVHRGVLRNWILLDWWEQTDILHHKLFSSPLTQSEFFSPEPDKTLIACVHELRIINFESQAWINSVLNDGLEGGLEKYLALSFSDKN